MASFSVSRGYSLCRTLSDYQLLGFSNPYKLYALCLSKKDYSDSSFHPKYNHGLHGKGKEAGSLGSKRDLQNIQSYGEVLFGIHPVLLALQASKRKRFFSLFIHSKQKSKMTKSILQIQTLAKTQGVPVSYVSKSTLTHLSCNRPHQGVCLDAGELVLPECEPEDLAQRKLSNDSKQLWLLLHNVQDPMNFGAILRSSYYLGVNQVVVPGSNSYMASPVVSKASSGALEVMNLSCLPTDDDSILRLIKAWQSKGGEVVGTASIETTNGSKLQNLRDYRLTRDTLLIVGNEGRGVDSGVLKQCDTLLTIPLPAGHRNEVQSLNVSVATGILIHWLQASREMTLPTCH
ncbi:rRNA methyltransferase 1, mitochondrial-like isoform X2 [Pomacea canaliculata]|nr:rRNA methyltransferase 1, mitochondrial-like isoform X2 [Pomacea canaliculata]